MAPAAQQRPAFSPDLNDADLQSLIDHFATQQGAGDASPASQTSSASPDGAMGGDPLTALAPGQRPTAGADPSHFDPPAFDPENPQAAMTPHDDGSDGSGGDLGQLQVNAQLVPIPAPPQPGMSPQDVRELKAAAAALYGADFPLLKESPPTPAEWVAWGQSLWERHRPGMQKILHMAEQHRLFRSDQQWITSSGLSPWREPPKPKDATRAVENVIKPALDLRVQIVREQMPGFRTRPTTQDSQSQKKAEAQQMALEYSYAEQDMASILAEAAYWAGTDGVSFLGPYWHPDAGPWFEDNGRQLPLGDVRTCVYRIEQVRVSANATGSRKPYYWIIRETIPTAEAVAQHGVAVVDVLDRGGAGATDLASTLSMDRLGLGTPGIQELYREQETVDRYTIYCERSEFLPNGMTMIAVGNVLAVEPSPLMYGVVPMVRFTDGSTDPAFFPVAIVRDWMASQMRINAAKSKWIDSVRVNATGRFIARKGAMVTETLVGGVTSVLEVNGPFTNPSEALVPVNGFSVGNDLKELLDRERTLFEQKSGWNDASRGSFQSDQSGRAILAVREQLERTFAPPVQAAAKAMSEWGKIVLSIYAKMLDMPRTIAITGKTRSDLSRQITAQDFDGVSEVEIDPETLMPMPRSLRLYLLEQLFQAGVITAQEYRRRLPFAFTGSIETPDDLQSARAKRICDAITNNQPVPEKRWTDDESIHQDTLEREILTRDDLDPMVIQAAMQRWTDLAQQAAYKSGALQMPQPGQQGQQGQPGKPQSPPGPQPGMDPREQPTFGSNPSVSAAPQSMQHPSDQQQAATGFDAANPS